MSSAVEVTEVKLNGTSLLTADGLKVNIQDITPGSGATDLGKAEDAQHASGDTGVMLLAVRDNEPPASTAAAGDYVPLMQDEVGQLYVRSGGTSVSKALTFVLLNADAYDANDVLSDALEVTGAVRFADGTGLITDLVLLDKDDQAAAAMDCYVMNAAVSLGTKDAAISISDTDAANILGVIPIAQTDWKDLINSKMAHVRNIGMIIKGVSGGTSIYLQLVTAGTPTQTTNGITGHLKITQD